MKKRLNSLLLISILAASCSIPKVSALKSIENIPNNFDSEETIKSVPASEITVKNYFNDPDLLVLFQKIEESNPDYHIAKERIDIANSFLKRAKLALLPSLDIGLQASGTRYGDYTMDGVGNYDTNLSQNISEKQRIQRNITPDYQLGAFSSWEIDLWGKLKNSKLAAQKRFLSSQEGARLIQIELFTDIANLYYELISIDQKKKIYKENLKIQKRANEIIAAQRIAGKATELAVQQFNAQNSNLLAEIEKLNVDAVSTEKAILSLLGMFEGTIERNTIFLNNHLEFLNRQMEVSAILHQRPDVASYYLELEATHFDAKAARAAFFPRLQIDARMGLHSFSAETFFNPASLAGQLLSGLVAPVFNKGQLKYEFNIAGKQQEIAFQNYKKSLINAYNELQVLLNHVQIYEQVLKYKSEEVQYLDRAVEVSNDLYLAGHANYLEIINSQRNKLQAELDLIENQFQTAKTNVVLFKALGGTAK